jgi:hypothetical protein
LAKHVFILGAGASAEVKLPVGTELKERIARALDFRMEFGHLKQGDAVLVDALRLHIHQQRGPNDTGDAYGYAARRIRDAMPQASSIDNYIDAHRGDEPIERCGKLAIVRCILTAERQSPMFVDRSKSDSGMRHEILATTWYNSLWQALSENCRRSDLESRFSSVSIVSFNYDRCIEHYLFHAVQNYYQVSAETAAALVKRIAIFHPYGRVGSLPWQGEATAIEFGGEVHAPQLLELSSQIKTFTEGSDPSSSDISAIRASLQVAQRLVFLGFAFHSQNLALLWPEKTTGGPSFCVGTARGISNSDLDLIREELEGLTGIGGPALTLRNDLTCYQLFSDYRRSLSALSRGG